jgi:hypothetical protein
MVPEGSLPHLQESATCPYLEWEQSSPYMSWGFHGDKIVWPDSRVNCLKTSDVSETHSVSILRERSRSLY